MTCLICNKPIYKNQAKAFKSIHRKKVEVHKKCLEIPEKHEKYSKPMSTIKKPGEDNDIQ